MHAVKCSMKAEVKTALVLSFLVVKENVQGAVYIPPQAMANAM